MKFVNADRQFQMEKMSSELYTTFMRMRIQSSMCIFFSSESVEARSKFILNISIMNVNQSCRERP